MSVTLQPGQTLTHYRIVEKIGQGGMGEVYRAEDTSLGREVAIKVLPVSFADNPTTRARFQREAKSIAALSHPNILAVHEFGSDSGTSFVVTELLEGETLRARLDQGPLPPHKAIDLARQAARGLAAAHERGIIHRDLKPENLFLTRDGRIKILDFGLATESTPVTTTGLTETPTRTSLTSPGTVMGTVGYMSPEQVRGETVNQCSDIFSLGAVLHEMLTGRRPFARETPAETMTAILREEPEDLASSASHVPPGLVPIIRRCLEKQPGERFQSASDLAFSLQGQSETSVPAGTAVVAPAVTARGRTSLLPWVGLALLVGAGLGFLAGSFTARSPSLDQPSFQRLSRRNGTISRARFVPGTSSLIYSAAWDGEALGLYSMSAGDPAATPLSFPEADLLSVSSNRELALLLNRRVIVGWEASGTLAVASQGSAPRPLLEDVLAADWGPDGKSLCVVHEVAGTVRLEYPIGTVLHESHGWISRPRIHPDGDRIAFVDHPDRGDNVGNILIVDRSGRVQDLGPGGSWGLVWSPDGKEIWHATGTSIYAVGPSSGPRTIYRAPIGLHLLDLAPDGQMLISTYRAQREMLISRAGTDRDQSLGWLDWSVPRDISLDGSTVLFEEGNQANADGYAMYIRRTDGTAPVQLGNGVPIALSPDARWVLAIRGYFQGPQEMVLVPTGPGEIRVLNTGDLRLGQEGAWVPASSPGQEPAVVFSAREPGGSLRLYSVSLSPGASPEAVTPADLPLSEWGVTVSPDGESVTAVPAGQPAMAFPLDGSAPAPLPGIEPHDRPLRYHQDGGHLFVYARPDVPGRVMRIDLASGERTPWRELNPLDPAGVSSIDRVCISADGEAHVYSYRRITSSLGIATNLQ